MVDEDRWRKRFYVLMAARLFGLAVFLAGAAIMFTDIVRDGGWTLVGGIIMIMGLVDAVVAPLLLRKQWVREDEAERGTDARRPRE